MDGVFRDLVRLGFQDQLGRKASLSMFASSSARVLLAASSMRFSIWI